MKYIGSIIGVVGVLLIAFLGYKIFTGGSSTPKVSTPSLTFSSVTSQLISGAELIDVRTPEEYAAGHFKGAINHSLQEMQAGKLPPVAKDTKLFVYCHSGNRSGQATKILKDVGYTNVTDLGGLAAVEKIGGKLVTEGAN